MTFPAGSPARASSALLRDLQVTAGPWNSPDHFQLELSVRQVLFYSRYCGAFSWNYTTDRQGNLW